MPLYSIQNKLHPEVVIHFQEVMTWDALQAYLAEHTDWEIKLTSPAFVKVTW